MTLKRVFSGLTLGVCLLAAGASVSAMPLVPGSVVEGQSLAQWGAAWWQWLASQAAPSDAASDTTGANAGNGQSGPVWFLGGTFGSTVERNFDVPAGRHLFFPLVNVVTYGADLSESDLLATANGFVTEIDSLFLNINGTDFLESDLFLHRETSSLFQIQGVAGNPLSVPTTPTNAISDGFYIMLPPLPVGMHSIRFGGGASAFSFETDVTAHIQIVAEPAVMFLLALGLIGAGYTRRPRKAR